MTNLTKYTEMVTSIFTFFDTQAFGYIVLIPFFAPPTTAKGLLRTYIYQS